MKPAEASPCADQRLDEQARGQHAAEPDHEHHRVLDLVAGRQALEGIP